MNKNTFKKNLINRDQQTKQLIKEDPQKFFNFLIEKAKEYPNSKFEIGDRVIRINATKDAIAASGTKGIVGGKCSLYDMLSFTSFDEEKEELDEEILKSIMVYSVSIELTEEQLEIQKEYHEIKTNNNDKVVYKTIIIVTETDLELI